MDHRDWNKEDLFRELNLLDERVQDIERAIVRWKHFQDTLQASETRLREVQQLVHIGHWEWKPRSGEVNWDEETCRILGLPADTPPSLEAFYRLVHPAHLDFVKNSLREALDKKKPYNVDIRLVRPDLLERTVNTRGQLEYDDSAEPTRMFGTVFDITERKQEEETLRESEEKFRNIFDFANDGIMIVNKATGKIIEANRAICSMLGHSREDMGGFGIVDIHPERDIAWILDEFDKQHKGLKTVSHNVPVRRRNNSVFYADISTTTLVLNGEQCWIGIFRDITERWRSEESIKNNEKFVRTILDTVDEGFIVIDRDYRIVTANMEYCNQVGAASCEEVVGRRCHEISHRAARPCHEEGEECAVRYVFESGEPYTAVHRHTDAEGVLVYVETKAFPIKDQAGTVTSVIETINDITEKHLTEEVRLKTQKLEAIGTLAGGIAHDFNNLLQGAFGYLSMARMSQDRKEQPLRMIEQAERALQMCANLTKQLLTFSKGGMPLKKPLSVSPLLVEAVKFALSGAIVDYRIVLDEDLRTVEADEGQIGQAIQNIVLNAKQAMPRGGTVLITARNVRLPKVSEGRLLEEGNHIEIAIQDSGVGIPQQHLGKIFDPYFSTREGGSGLGLATAYSIIKNHGGMISVDSEIDRGSTFFIYLPALDSEQGSLPAVTAAAITDKKGKILVMDDEELIRRIAGEMLKACNHDVECAKHGEEAIEKYRAALKSGIPFDIIILDLTIRGGLGGKETLERIRRFDPDVKAIVSSGYSDDAVVSDFSSYGFRACLSKPYKLEELKNTLNQLLS